MALFYHQPRYLNLFYYYIIDGKIKQKQEQIPKRDLTDERYDEACQKEAFERELHHLPRPWHRCHEQ